MTSLVLVLKKIESEEKAKYDNFFSSSKTEVIINESELMMLQSIYITIITNTQKSLGKCSDWITNLVIDHITRISKYNPLTGSTYIILPKELDHPRKGFINIQNSDENKCFNWCFARYLNPADNHPRITQELQKLIKILLKCSILMI